MAVTSHDRRGHGQRVENGFFRRLDRCSDQGVQMRVGKVNLLKRRLLWVVRNDIRGGERQHEIPASVTCGGACTSQTQSSTFCQSSELPIVERGIGGNDDDDRTFALPG